jgi:hypothetical protein
MNVWLTESLASIDSSKLSLVVLEQGQKHISFEKPLDPSQGFLTLSCVPLKNKIYTQWLGSVC